MSKNIKAKRQSQRESLERIAISLDSIDGSMSRMAAAYETIVDLATEQNPRNKEHLEVAKANFAIYSRVMGLHLQPQRPWWKKLLGIKEER